MTDTELLAQHAEGSREAFAELVRRHVDWVYSVARRRVRDEHLSEDVTQATFVVLFNRPPRLRPGQALSAWLFTVVHHTALQALRAESRRHHHETEAAKMRSEQPMPDPVEMEELATQMDAILLRLASADRQAVLLRFYEKKSFAEVGVAMGTTEEAARKRVSRATDKLRRMLEAKSITSPAMGLTGVLMSEAVKPAPIALAQHILAGGTSLAATGSAASLAKGAITIMALTKMKLTVVTALCAILLIGGGTVAVVMMTRGNPSSPAMDVGPVKPPAPAPVYSGATAVATPAAEPAGWRERFDQVYRLQDGQIIQRIAPPFIPERASYYRIEHISQAESIPKPPDYFTFFWENGQLKHWGLGFNGGKNPLSSVLGDSFGMKTYEFEGDQNLLSLNIGGDWIIRSGATPAQKLSALAATVAEASGRHVRFELQSLERDVIVASGKYSFHAEAGASDATSVNLHTDKLIQSQGGGGAGGYLPEFLADLGSQMNLRVIDETEGTKPPSFRWRYNNIWQMRNMKPGVARDEQVQKLLDVVSAQTDLKFSRERRKVDVWVLTEDKP